MDRLTENDFSFKCPMNWDEMSPSANGRFCKQCQKEVFDLTNCSLDEVAVLQKKHGAICGTIRVAQVAVVAASLSAAACQETPPVVRTTGTPMPVKGDSENVVTGKIAPVEKPDKQAAKQEP